MIRIVKFRKCNKNTLQGFITIEIDKTKMEIRDLALHQKNGNYWIKFPAKPFTDERSGEQKWMPYIKINDKDIMDIFSNSVIKALKEEKYIS